MISNWGLIAFGLAALPGALAQQSVWGQCGGTGWSGAKTCASGNTCVVLNNYYYQCQPRTASTTTTASTRTSSSVSTTSTAITTNAPTLTTSTPSRTTTSTGSSTSGTGAGATLQSGYTWIRAVAAPNYHRYLQTSPLNTSPGRAVLSDASTAGQFQLSSDGQLVELIDTKGSTMYANVGEQPNATATYLPVTFTSSKNAFGTFAYQGDTLTWSAVGVQRQNVAAWYVCEGQRLWINLGAYAYGTPAGCADQTIYSYGNSVADV